MFMQFLEGATRYQEDGTPDVGSDLWMLAEIAFESKFSTLANVFIISLNDVNMCSDAGHLIGRTKHVGDAASSDWLS